jgi:hypothetical protein
MGDVERLVVELDIGAADLDLAADGSQALTGEMRYNLPSYRPQYAYDERWDRGYVTIEQTRRGMG